MSPSERRATVVRLVIAGVVLVGGYLGLCAWSAGHLPSSVSVGGIQVGGMSPDDAEAAIDRGAATLLSRPIALTRPGADTSTGTDSGTDTGTGTTTADEPRIEVVPGTVGFSVDAKASVQGLIGFTLNPATVWNRLTGDVAAPLTTEVDATKLRAALDALAPRFAKAPVEGSVTFPGGKVTVVEPVPGAALDVDDTVRELRGAFPHSTSVEVPVTPVAPKVSAETVRAAAAGPAAKAVSAPVTVVAGATSAPLQPADFAPALSMRPDGQGGLALAFDDRKLAAAVKGKVKIATRPARDATWKFVNDRPRIVPSIEGLVIDDKLVASAVAAAISSDTRRADVKATVAKPKFSTADAQKAGVKQAVVHFKSPFPPDDVTRTNNLVVATRTINGHYLAPGETFSLNGVLGERNTAKGYKDGTVIINGRLTRGTGGGVSQVSTTIHNMAYFAGADIISATPHSFFIPRYPEGREATVYWPSLDNKWKNDTPYGMLLQTWVADGYVHGRVWSTKTWDIRSVKGPRRNVVQPRTIRDDSLTCYPQQPQPGFDVTVTRQWYRPGSSTLVKSEATHTHYIPEHEVICTNPKAKP